MLLKLYQWLPPEGVKILLVLFLSFLIGLEREERKVKGEKYAFGGVRTFPLIGLIGYSIALARRRPTDAGHAGFCGDCRLSAAFLPA